MKNAGDVTPPPSEGAGGRLFWFLACAAADIPENGGGCVKYGDKQIAVFNFTRRGEWYATDNMCPHRMQMALSRGMIGTQGDEPKVACPFHKKTFSLETGACLNGDDYQIKTYPVKVEDGLVYISLPQPPPKEGAFELAK
ncbi:MAG: nitrite reductase small subunit NirD [Cytophagales bacterium]|nr:nitrite reductase small subunit NirD [Cytophagales bacterium]